MRRVLRWSVISYGFGLFFFSVLSAQEKPSLPKLAGAHILAGVRDMHVVCGPCECHLEPDRKQRKVSEKTAPVQESKPQAEDNCHQLVERFVVPFYPGLALTARITGAVIVQVEIDSEGDVLEAQPIEGHPMLCNAAQAAVRGWKFRPSDIPAKMVTVRFEFSDDPERNPPRVQVNPPDELQLVAPLPIVQSSVARAKSPKSKTKTTTPKKTLSTH